MATLFLRLSVIDLLLLLQHRNESVIPLTFLPTCLINSPSIGSTLITSAPWSPKIIVAVGPDTIAVKSTTLIPDKGPLFLIHHSLVT